MTLCLVRSTLAGKMTEFTPVQDPSIPAPVPTPEAPRDNFGIQNFYNPESLYIYYLPETTNPAISISTTTGQKFLKMDMIPSLKLTPLFQPISKLNTT